jgi:hypothetical protein
MVFVCFLEYIVKIKNYNTVCRFSSAVQPNFANFKLNQNQIQKCETSQVKHTSSIGK